MEKLNSVIEFIRMMIGEPPPELAWLEYAVAAVFLLMVFRFLTGFIIDLGKIATGR